MAEPNFIPQMEETDGDLPIPDVSNANLMGRDGNFLGEGDPGDEQPEQEEQPQAPVAQAPAQEKEFINPQAYARIKERESRDLQIKLDRLLQIVQQKDEPEEEPQEEIDPELDPIGSLKAQIAHLESTIQEREQRAQTEQQQRVAAAALTQADSIIQNSIRANPAVYQGAIMHLARVIESNVERQMPDYTEAERLAVTAQQVAGKKLEWVSQGLNPADEMLKMAMSFGFNPQAAIAQVPAPVQEAARASVDSRAKVQKSKQRQAQTASLGGTQGAPVSGLTAEALKAMDMDTFNYTVNQAINAGQLRPMRTVGKTPSFADLLPGKGIRVR